MLPTLLVVTALFALLLVGRVGGARRRQVLERWPVLIFAGGALLALSRGAFGPALALAGLSVLAWWLSPRLLTRGAPPEDPADAAARKALGLRRGASEAEIRAAYRAKIARAHPDRGGSNAEAARLTAARDRLLKGK